jgi:release factor glutamine methyltransferase
MKRLMRHIIGFTYKPLVKKYLSKERVYHYDGLHLRIHPDVFHPGFFFSTRLLLAQLQKMHLDGKLLLELGAGSGLISMIAAKKKAIVTASDINPVAVEYLRKNSSAINIPITILEADVFSDIPANKFDIIAINPPYYKKKPTSFATYAWYCGENGEYFQKLFSGLAAYMHQQTTVLMVLCNGCDIQMIMNSANAHHFAMQQVLVKKNLVETNYIYSITKAA